MKITITLKEPARSQAEQALIRRGLRMSNDVAALSQVKQEPFFGPVFDDATLSLDEDVCPSGFICIKVEGASYLYPLRDIARLKLS